MKLKRETVRTFGGKFVREYFVSQKLKHIDWVCQQMEILEHEPKFCSSLSQMTFLTQSTYLHHNHSIKFSRLSFYSKEK